MTLRPRWLCCCRRSRSVMSVPEPKAAFGRVPCQVAKVPKAAASRLRKLAPRRPSANAVEALLDRGEAPVDHGFVLGVGEDVGPVIFDGLANQFADIKRIDAIVGPVLECLDGIGDRSFCRRQTADLPAEPPRHFGPEINALRAEGA